MLTLSGLKLPNGDEFNVERYVKRRSSLRDDFSTYRDHGREVSQHFRPRRGFWLDRSDMGDASQDGRKRHQKVVNSTPLRVAKNAQSGLQAGVTSPSRPWKKIGPDRSEINEIPGAKEFFDEIDKGLDFVFAKSNFYRATHTGYGDFVDHGPAALQIDEHDGDTIRCQVHPFGSWVGTTNADGRVDVFYRDYRITGYEIVDKFGNANIPEQVLQGIRINPYKRHTIHNAIEPNPFFKQGPAIGIAAFRYLSVWWIKGHGEDFLKVHGYHEFPVMVYRFTKSENNDAYGYGAGADGLPDAKSLQHMETMSLQALDKMVSPPLQAPTSLKQRGVSVVPNKINYHDGQQKIESIYNMNIPINYVEEKIRQAEQRLKETFFEDLFLMISQSVQRQVTAREIEERHEEKLIMLGPVLESINDELLDPSIDRTLGIMRRAGLFPAAPPELQGVEFKVEYISILAQAQRAIQTIAIEQGINFAGAAAQQGFEEALDRVNIDGAIDEYHDRIGFPPKGTRSLSDAEALREARAARIQQAEQLERLGSLAATGKDAAAASEQIQPNVLQQLLGGATAA